MHRNQYFFWRQIRQGLHHATENCPAFDDEDVMSTIENSPVNQDRYGHMEVMYDHGKKWPVETCILSTPSGIYLVCGKWVFL